MEDRRSLPVAIAQGVPFVAALAVGLSVALPIGVFSLPRQALIAIPGHAVPAFGLSLLCFLPLSYIYFQFNAGRVQAGDVLSLARRLRSAPLSFTVGWLALAGYSLVAALLLRVMGGVLSEVLTHFAGTQISSQICTAAAAGAILLKETISRREWWGARSWLTFLLSIGILAVLALRFVTVPQGVGDVPRVPQFDRGPAIVGVLACLMWAADAVTLHSAQLQKRARTALSATVVTLIVAVSASTVMVLLHLRNPEKVFHSDVFAVGFQATPTLLATAVFALLLASVGLSRMTRSAQRVATALWPEKDPSPEHLSQVNLAVLLFVLAAASASAHFIPRLTLAAGAGAAFLWASSLLFIPVAASKENATKVVGKQKAGRARTWATVGMLLTVPASVMLPFSMVAGLALWLLFGVVGFFSISSLRRGHEAEAEEFTRVEMDGGVQQHEVLSVVTEGADLESLVRAADAIAETRGSRALLLKVLPFNESLTPRAQRRVAHQARDRLEKLVERLGKSADKVDVAIRLGPSTPETIRSLCEGSDIELLLLSIGDFRDTAEAELELVQEAFTCVSLPTALVYGRYRSRPRRARVHLHAQHKSLGLSRLGARLVREDGEVELLFPETEEGKELHDNVALALNRGRPLEKSTSDSEDSDSEKSNSEDSSEAVQPALAPAPGAEVIASPFNTAREGWARLTEAPLGTLLVAEAAKDPVLGRSMYGGMPFDLARGHRGVTVIYKPAEKVAGFAWRRGAERLIDLVPPLDDEERMQILTEQARAARGTKDFYFLMVVASVIAIAGLLADSGAVVIGAMLVAPLMQPIIGLAMGITIGSGVRIRRSARAIAGGAATSVAVATLITMLFPIHDAPPQVLARTSPNLLDLIVALAAGAAGSYGASRKSIAGAIPGVAIAVALVPPLCVVGFGIGADEWQISAGATLLFLTNLAGIVLVSTLIFTLFGFRPTRRKGSKVVRLGVSGALIGLFILAIPLGMATFSSFESRLISWRLKHDVQDIEKAHGVLVERIDVEPQNGRFLVHGVFLSSENLTEEQVYALRVDLKERAREDVFVELVVLNASVLR